MLALQYGTSNLVLHIYETTLSGELSLFEIPIVVATYNVLKRVILEGIANYIIPE